MHFLRRLVRVWTWFLLWVLVSVMAVWTAWKSHLLFGDLASEWQAPGAARTVVAEGRRHAPARLHQDLRGERNTDYWCFADGLCFYSLEGFRAHYPIYNDLDDDDVLLAELHREAGAPRDAFDRGMSWVPVGSYLKAVAIPLLLVLIVICAAWREVAAARMPSRAPR